MDLIFYKTNSPNQMADKVLTNDMSVNGNLKANCDILNPSITIEYNNNVLGYNYVYIPAFARYYYITGFNIVNNTISVSLKCDVLKSHINDIKNSIGTVIRSQSGSKFLNDSRIVNTSEHSYQFKKMGTGFTKRDCYVLNVVGD